MFWIDPIYKVLYICIENGETYKESDKEPHKFERATCHKKYIPTQVQGWKNRARLIASYSFKPAKITKHSWISEMSFWCFMIIAFLTIIAGITFGRNTIFSYDVKFWLTILGILALSVGTVHVVSPKEKQSLHHLVGKQKMYIINTFFLLSSISISLNYFISSGDAKQAIVTIDDTWMNRGRHHLTFAKFRFPPHNNEKVSCNIPEDTYENIKPGDKCIVHYYKGIMGYLVIRSLTKVEWCPLQKHNLQLCNFHVFSFSCFITHRPLTYRWISVILLKRIFATWWNHTLSSKYRWTQEHGFSFRRIGYRHSAHQLQLTDMRKMGKTIRNKYKL